MPANSDAVRRRTFLAIFLVPLLPTWRKDNRCYHQLLAVFWEGVGGWHASGASLIFNFPSVRTSVKMKVVGRVETRRRLVLKLNFNDKVVARCWVVTRGVLKTEESFATQGGVSFSNSPFIPNPRNSRNSHQKTLYLLIASVRHVRSMQTLFTFHSGSIGGYKGGERDARGEGESCVQLQRMAGDDLLHLIAGLKCS